MMTIFSPAEYDATSLDVKALSQVKVSAQYTKLIKAYQSSP
jgi:hypothetical protein